MNAIRWSYLPLAIVLAAATPVQAQHEHEGHAAHAGDAAATVIPAQRHATDAPLREGMARIRVALDELAHYEMGHMPQSMAVERVDEIKSATDFLFANCKLDATADAALHGMLAPLLAGVQAFRADPQDTASIERMRKAVADYPLVFDDPAWTLPEGDPVDHAH